MNAEGQISDGSPGMCPCSSGTGCPLTCLTPWAAIHVSGTILKSSSTFHVNPESVRQTRVISLPLTPPVWRRADWRVTFAAFVNVLVLLEPPVRLLVGLPVQSGPQVRLTFVDAHVAAGAVQFFCGHGGVHVGLQGQWVQAVCRHHVERLRRESERVMTANTDRSSEKGSGLVCRNNGERLNEWMDRQATMEDFHTIFPINLSHRQGEVHQTGCTLITFFILF